MLLAAATNGRLRVWPAAAVCAAQVFVAWECLVALLYGQSHFLHALASAAEPAEPLAERVVEKAALVNALLGNLGGVAPFLAVGGLVALGARRRWLAAAAAAVVLGFAAVALADVDCAGPLRFLPGLPGAPP